MNGELKKLICIWLHRGVMPALATRYSASDLRVRHEPLDTEGKWLPVNVYHFGDASPWPKQ